MNQALNDGSQFVFDSLDPVPIFEICSSKALANNYGLYECKVEVDPFRSNGDLTNLLPIPENQKEISEQTRRFDGEFPK